MMLTVEKEENNEQWPVPATLLAILDQNFQPLVTGWLTELSRTIESPVVFVYKDNDYKIIDDIREYGNSACELCAYLRDKSLCGESIKNLCCNKSDKNAAATVYEYVSNEIRDLPPNWEPDKYGNKEDLDIVNVFYKYQCMVTGLTEWIIPVYVNSKIAGTFITGQFIGNPKKAFEILDVLRANSVAGIEKLNEEAITAKMKKTKSEPKNGDEKWMSFFECLMRIQSDINTDYNKVVAFKAREIQHQLMDMIWDKKGLYNDAHSIDTSIIQSISARFRAARTNLFDCAIFLKNILGLDGVTVFKPRSDPSVLDSNGKVEGAVVDREQVKHENDGLTFDRDFPLAPYSISMQSDLWNKSKVVGRIVTLTLLQDGCKQLLIENVPGDLSRCVLCTYATKGYERYPVAYLLRFPDTCVDLKTQWSQQQPWLGEFLEQISTAFLAQWNMVYAEYHRLSYELGNRYLSHELGQVIAGMQARMEKFDKALSDAQYQLSGYSLPVEVSKLLEEGSLFDRDQNAYIRMIAAISKNAFIFTDTQKLRLEEFYPFDRFLYRLISVYKNENIYYGRIIITPQVSSGDPYRPKMYADPSMLEQALNNLLRNAYKYSHSYTKIYVNAKLSEDKKNYVFSVTNYGLPINEKEGDHLFELGYRAENAKEIDANGIGFGLYIVDKFAKLHKGKAYYKSEHLSDFNIPFLKAYLESTHIQKKESLVQQCKEELENLKRSGIYKEVVSEEAPDNPFSPIYYLRHIQDATARITFKISIPVRI